MMGTHLLLIYAAIGVVIQPEENVAVLLYSFISV